MAEVTLTLRDSSGVLIEDITVDATEAFDVATGHRDHGDIVEVTDSSGFGPLIADTEHLEWFQDLATTADRKVTFDFEAFFTWIDNEYADPWSYDASYLLARFRDVYHGHFDSKEDFARDWAENCIQSIPPALEPHIDWESMADSLAEDYLVLDSERGGIDVFYE